MTAEETAQVMAETQKIVNELVRGLASQKTPEFSSEPMTVKDAAKLTGLTENKIRAGIQHGWLPIGVAIKDGKLADEKASKLDFVIFPRKIWELTGHVWKGKQA